MSKISIYDVVPVPKLADKLVGTSVGGDPEDLTYNFTLGDLLNLFIPNIPGNTLQGVLDFGNTATQNINLTGTVNTTNLTVSATANILNSNLTGQTHITGGVFDRLNSIGTAGQVLTSTGTQVEWYTIPTIIPNLQQVLTAGNTAVNNIILTGNITANNAALLTATISTSLTLLGTVKDGLSSVGTINQVLSSNGTGVRWINLPVYSATSPLLYNSATGVFSIQQANASQSGYLSSADWITFDGKQTAIILTTTGSSGPSTLVGATINIPNYTLAGLGGVPQTRTLTINGVTYNLSADRSWTIATGVSSVTASSPLFSTGGATPNITIQQSSSTLDGYLSSVDWLTFNSKQALLGGTGLVKSVGGTISYITDNSANWNTAYNDSIVSAAVTGTATKTLTLNQQDGGTITASWSDIDTGLTSVGVSMPAAFTVTNSPLTSNGTIAITGSGNGLQYIDGTGALQTFPSLTGFVPYTGATANVNLGIYSLTASALIKNGGTSGQFLKADGSVDSSAYIVLGSLSASAPLSYNNLTGAFSIIQSGTVTDGYLSSTDWNTFNNKQGALTLTTTGTSGASTLIGNTLNIPNYTDQFTGTVTSVGLTMPAAFTVSNSPVTSSGTLTVVGAGLASQYVRGDGSLGDFPGGGGGGGSSVSYYLNGSVNQGTFVGNTYYEMSKVPVFGAGTDFNIATNGYISQFITDANDPESLLIPAGNWNFETYFSASSAGGSPTFYVELYKYDGTTFTLIADNSATPELISFGTNIEPYFSSVAVPETVLTITDRLAIRVYVNNSGRTITLHTEDSHLCQIVTTFTTGLTTLNGLTTQVQYFSTGTSGADFNISSAVATHTFNLPTASAVNRGALSSADWTTFDSKQPAGNYVTTDTTQTITALKTILRGGDVLNFKIGVDTLYGLKIAYNQNELVPSGEATWSFVNTFNNGLGTGLETTPISFFRGVLVTGERLLSVSVNSNLLSYYGNNPSGRYPIYAYNTGVQQFQDSILVGFNTGVVNVVTGAIASLPAGVVANFNGRVIGSNAVNSNEFATLGQLTGGTVTSVGLTSVTSGVTIGSTPITTSGNITIAIATATGSQNGLLSSTDWTTFNSKQGAITLTTTGTSGASTLVGNTLNIPNYTDSFVGTVTSVSFTLGATGTNLSASVATSTTTPAITLNVPTASASARGALSSTDWSTFNGKQNAITLTTTGTSGASTLVGATLNIPDYGSALSAYLPLAGGIMTGQIVLKEGTTITDYTKGLRFPNDPYGGSGDTSGLRLYAETTTGAEAQVLELYVTNDGPGTPVDRINFAAPTNDLVTINGNKIWNIGNLPTPQSAITLTTTGTSGAATFSSNTLNIPQYQSVITNPVTGTGTTNYLPKFTGTSTIGNSAFYDGGGFGGFNSTGLGVRTFVINAASGRPLALEVVEFANIHSIYVRPNNSGFNLISSNYISGGVYLPLSLSARENNADLVLQTGGNVTIGTTTDAGYKLDVNGTGRFGGTSTYNGFLIGSHSNNVGAAIYNKALANATLYADSASTVLNAETNLFLRTGNTDRLTIASTGAATFSSSVQATAMSIGVTPTANILVVKGENATNDGTIQFGARGYLQHRDAGQTITSLANDYNNDAAKIEFRVKGNSTSDAKMTILGSGNVGIGTASPNRKLEVITGEAVTNGIRLTKATGVVSEGLDITYLDSGQTTSSFDSIYNSDTAVMRFRMKTGGTPVTAMTILGSGNVGIGTTSPISSLMVSKTLASNQTYLTLDNKTNSKFNWGIDWAVLDSTNIPVAAIRAIYPADNDISLAFFTYNGSGNVTERMRIATGGNVLIGTTTDNGSKLQVTGAATFSSSVETVARFSSSGDSTIIIGGNAAQGISSGEQYITYQNGTTNSNAWMVGMDDGEDWRFAYGAVGEITDANSLIKLTQSGNVLIGTTTDSGYKLQVSGDTQLSGITGINCAPVSGVVLSIKTQNNGSADFGLKIRNSSDTNLFYVRNDGLVGFPKINDFTTGNSPNTWINPASSYGIYINTSSIRYKKDIVNYDKGLNILNQLRPVYYKSKSKVDGDKQFAGFIAEEIDKLGLTEFVNYLEDGRPNSLSYPNMIVLLTKAIQEQQAQIEELKNKLS